MAWSSGRGVAGPLAPRTWCPHEFCFLASLRARTFFARLTAALKNLAFALRMPRLPERSCWCAMPASWQRSVSAGAAGSSTVPHSGVAGDPAALPARRVEAKGAPSRAECLLPVWRLRSGPDLSVRIGRTSLCIAAGAVLAARRRRAAGRRGGAPGAGGSGPEGEEPPVVRRTPSVACLSQRGGPLPPCIAFGLCRRFSGQAPQDIIR